MNRARGTSQEQSLECCVHVHVGHQWISPYIMHCVLSSMHRNLREGSQILLVCRQTVLYQNQVGVRRIHEKILKNCWHTGVDRQFSTDLSWLVRFRVWDRHRRPSAKSRSRNVEKRKYLKYDTHLQWDRHISAKLIWINVKIGILLLMYFSFSAKDDCRVLFYWWYPVQNERTILVYNDFFQYSI